MPSINKKSKKINWLDYRVITVILIIKFLILGFAVQAFQIVGDQPIGEVYQYFEIWKRWDAESFLHIAESGYTAEGEHRFRIVFLPFYPALIALFEIFTGDYLVSAFIVSSIATLILGLVFRELVKLDHPEKVAQYAILFLFIFPTSFYLHIPYTESLFLALAVGSFLAARKRSWLLVGILGGLACLTRVNGVILIPALAFEVWEEYRETKRLNIKWLSLLLIPLGFGLYLFINYYVTGNPIMFMTHQREHWFRYFRFPWEGIWETYKSISFKKPSEAQMHVVQELLFVGIGLFATILGWWRLRNSYRVWMVLNWLLFISTSFVLSVPRYTLIMFPIFILMASVAVRNWWANVLFTVWSILFLAIFTTQFVRGWWAF